MVRWMGVLVAAGLCTSCSSGASNEPPAPSGSGPTTDAAPAAADADTVCTAKAPVAATSLTGKWAWKIVASRFQPATGFVLAFHTRTISILLVDQTQTGTDLTASATYCNQYAEDPEAQAHVIIPDAYVRILKPFTAQGTYDGQRLHFSPIVEVVGAKLANPSTDALPTDATDARVTDDDADGHPGVTIMLQGAVGGALYTAQRNVGQPLAVAVSSTRLEGYYAFTSEQSILGSDTTGLDTLAKQQTAIVDPDTCASTFTAVSVAATATCADIASDAGSPF
jgi:hypothetical protein